MILERDNWTTPVDFILCDIYEYDMRRAGLSIIKERHLLPDETIWKIESMEKHDADVYIGKLERKNKDLKIGKNEGFKIYRLEFGNLNDLDDDNIISVKKDAIFVNKYCSRNKIGKHIEFREKNYYNAFLRIGKLEFYWNADTGHIDVKGIQDDRVDLHRGYMLDMISNLLKYLARYDYDGARSYLVDFMDKYKHRNLPAGYFRSLDPLSKFSMVIGDRVCTIEADDIGDEYLMQLCIDGNYLDILVPLLGLV